MNLLKIICLLVQGLLSACAYLPKQPIHLKIHSSVELNQTQTQQSLPVKLRIYQLSDISAFKQLSFRELWKQDKALLGKSLLQRKEISVFPNEQVYLTIKRDPKAKVLGLVAIFRRIDGPGWRDWTILPHEVTQRFHSIPIALSHQRVEIK